MAQQIGIYDRPTGPSIRPLKRTSPTTNEELRACFMRAAFQNDQRFSDIRPISTYTLLGSISHRLLEVASRGEFDSTDEGTLEGAIHSRWLELVQNEFQSLQNKTLSAVLLPQKWPKYALRMVAACKAAYRIASQRKKKYAGAEDILLAEQTKVEVWYGGYNGRLVGRIDLIRHTSSGMELVDYKSGLVMLHDEADGKTQRLQEPYERQMLLYVALVHENEGQWPTMATVESLIDGPHIVNFAPEDSENAVKEALQLLDTYNRRAAADEIRGTPDENNCRWCSFKALCRDFLETADVSWTQPSITIIGRVVSVHASPPAFITLEIIGGDYYKGLVNIRGIPVNVIPMIDNLGNCLISFGNLRQTLGTNDLVFIWSSVFWRWLDLRSESWFSR